VIRIVPRILCHLIATIVAASSLAACVSGGSDRRETPEVPPILGMLSHVDLTTFRLPLDQYRPTSREEVLLARAESMLFRQCMRRFGFDQKITNAGSTRPGPGGAHVNRYGLADGNVASKAGYHLPAQDANHDKEPTQLRTAAEKTVATGVGQSKYRGRSVPRGGCLGEARSLLLRGSTGPIDSQLIETISIDYSNQAERDARVQNAFAAWSSCMKRAGYHYRTPWDPNDDPSFHGEQVSAREIRTAKADVGCKGRVKLIDVWAAVETAYQRRAIERHSEQLKLIQIQLDTRLANARRVLADQ